MILQAISQLKGIYKDNTDTIIGNMDTKLFLGGGEKTTLKELSELLGKETIDMYSTSRSYGQSPSSGMNYQKVGRELMSQDEMFQMDGGKCILSIRGARPFLSSKFNIEGHHNYKYLADYDKSLEFDIENFVNVQKKNRDELLKGVTKSNTKITRIVIGDGKKSKMPNAPSKLTTPAETEAENAGDFDQNDTELI